VRCKIHANPWQTESAEPQTLSKVGEQRGIQIVAHFIIQFPCRSSVQYQLNTIISMPINIRLNDSKRPDLTDLINKTNSDFLRTASIQSSTKKEVTAARNILSKSALNNRIERKNALSKKQINRGGIAHTNN
jgi:hypothetical protein